MPSRPLVYLGAVLVVATAIGLNAMREESSRKALYDDAMATARQLERDNEYARAVGIYQQALTLEIEGDERANIRYLLTRALIESNNLDAAMGVLDTLTKEDVVTYHYDVGPLYLDLGDKAMNAGNRTLANIAYRMGEAASPDRAEAFGKRKEQFIRQPDPADQENE